MAQSHPIMFPQTPAVLILGASDFAARITPGKDIEACLCCQSRIIRLEFPAFSSASYGIKRPAARLDFSQIPRENHIVGRYRVGDVISA
jgi:hypothetical protein